MRTVWKYKLEMGVTEIVLPEGSKMLTAGMQAAGMHIWVDQSSEPGVPGIQYTFYVFGTGHSIIHGPHAHFDYIATVFDTPFVWHVYKGW